MTSALSTPAQRHIVRVQSSSRSPVYLLAAQNDGYSSLEYGLLWYRSDDGGVTWSHYGDLVAQPDPTVFNASLQPPTLHLTADLHVAGNDVAAVYSYDSTNTGFPASAWDPERGVYFQWWRFDGKNDWVAGPRLTLASPEPGQAYRRAEVAQDSLGRLWVQAFLRQSDCSNPGTASCVGDLLQVWVSSDGGETFQGPQTLAALPNQIGGGRLISVGSKLLMLWADASQRSAQLMTRSDSDPVTAWSAQRNAFADGAHIYHGASLSAVPDGVGGLHLLYKEWVSPPDGQQLYYRHFDGVAFGSKTPVGSLGDWALQPAATGSGSELYVCTNQTLSPGTNYEMRAYRLGAGFGTWSVIDGQVNGKAYPAAPERVPATDSTIPCAFGMGNQTTNTWGAGHTVQVAQEPVQPTVTPVAAAPTFSPPPGLYPTAQSVTLSDATPGASIFYTTDGTTPTASATRYTGPISVGSATTLNAIATAPGFTSSGVATATYTIQGASVALFSDDFARTTGLGASWNLWYGTYATSGAAAVSGAAPIQGNWASVAPPLGTNDYAVSATVTIPGHALYSGIVARGNPSSFTSDLYSAQLSYDGTANLYRRNAWSWTRLASVGAGIVSGTPYVLQLAVSGTSPVHLEVSLAGATVISVDDASPNRLTAGVPGIECYDQGVTYQRFAVTQVGAPTPTPTPVAAMPTFGLPPGLYQAAQSVTLSDTTPGASIFYTTDGTTPTPSSPQYTGPIPVGSTTTLNAIATAPGFTSSGVATATYTIQGPSAALFSDEFARTTGLGASWSVWHGTYATSGAGAVSGMTPIQGNWASVVPPLGTNDYAVSATVTIPGGALYSGIVARGNPSSFTSDLYSAQLAYDGTVNLYRRNAWSWTRLASVGAGIVSGTPYALQLAVSGASPVHLEVSLAGATVLSFDDGSPSRLTAGVPGIECYDQDVTYQRFAVLAR
jgi:hypothetical protein